MHADGPSNFVTIHYSDWHKLCSTSSVMEIINSVGWDDAQVRPLLLEVRQVSKHIWRLWWSLYPENHSNY